MFFAQWGISNCYFSVFHCVQDIESHLKVSYIYSCSAFWDIPIRVCDNTKNWKKEQQQKKKIQTIKTRIDFNNPLSGDC